MSYKIKSNCLKFSSALVFLLIFQVAFAQANKKNPKELGITRFSELDELVRQNQKALGNDIIAMVWTDTLVYKRELGQFDARTLAPVEGSSQWLTAALVLKIAEEGKISLDDKVSDFIPIFSTYGKNYITIRHCLSHFTGVQTDQKLFNKKKFTSLEDEVISYAKREIKTNPGTEFSYSAVGTNIAGRILEIVTKKKFDMLIKQKLFNPLGMRKSSFSDMQGGPIDPSAGARTTADEFMNFLRMLLNNGRHNGQQFLSEASMKELRALTTSADLIKYAPKTTQGFNYALGSWVVEEGSNKEANSVSGAAINGTWPMINWDKKYAFLIFVKNPEEEQKKEPYLQMIDAVEEGL
jgi:CubicO group peptidase (beta-lactamase class C family)